MDEQFGWLKDFDWVRAMERMGVEVGKNVNSWWKLYFEGERIDWFEYNNSFRSASDSRALDNVMEIIFEFGKPEEMINELLWVDELMKQNIEVVKRNAHHFSLYMGEERVDYWPKKKKYHVVETDERGTVKDEMGLVLMFKGDQVIDWDARKEEAFDLYRKRVGAWEIPKKWDEKGLVMYELEWKGELLFAFSSSAKTRPEMLRMPDEMDVLLKRSGNMVYMDDLKERVVYWIGSNGKFNFTKYTEELLATRRKLLGNNI